MYDQDRNGDSGAIAELCGKIDLHIGSVSKLTKAMQRRPPPAQPVFGRVATQGLAVTGAVLILEFPLRGPDQGHFWYVRNLVVGGLTPTTTAAGRCDVYVCAATVPASLTAIGLGDWRDQSIALPNIAYYGTGELELRAGEKLFIAISGGTNAQQYVASMSFEDYEEGPTTRQEWSL